jgi:UDP-N-acetylmuramate dehydrogenase
MISIEDSEKKLKEEFGDRIVSNRPLADLNTFGTGGNARLFIDVASVDELSKIVRAASNMEIPYFLLGGGSNLLVSDNGYEGLVIKNSIKGMEVVGTNIRCGAGEKLQALVDFATQKSLTGLEFATGIYGTVGGAVYGNAGAYGAEVGDIFESGQLVDKQGNIRTEEAAYFEFGYRDSRLKRTREVIAMANFALKMGNKDTIKRRVDEIQALRDEKLPINAFTAGCFFKNIPDNREKFGKLAAGKLLEDIGAKSIRYKGALVFDKHANIIINDGSASSSDIRQLAKLLKMKVREKFNIELTEEITTLGKFEEDSV